MKRICTVVALTLLASAAPAQCPSEDATFLACMVETSGKSLSVCLEDGAVVYRFGPVGAPELILSQSVAQVDYRPWNGVGKAIYEEVRFPRSDVSYVVFGGIDRIDGEEEIIAAPFGGVEVIRGETVLGKFSCTPETTRFSWGEGLSNAKRAAGFTWKGVQQKWVKTAD